MRRARESLGPSSIRAAYGGSRQFVTRAMGWAHRRVIGPLEIGRPRISPEVVEGRWAPKGAVFLECSRMRDSLPLFVPASHAASATRRSAPMG